MPLDINILAFNYQKQKKPKKVVTLINENLLVKRREVQKQIDLTIKILILIKSIKKRDKEIDRDTREIS